MKENQLKKILVPVDYFESSDNAIMYAFALGKMLKAELHLMHVRPEGSGVTGSQQQKEGLEEYIRDLVTEAEIGSTIFSYSVVTGEPASQIASLAENFDLVIMGLKGGNVLNRAFVGGIAWEVASRAGFPVIMLPSNARFEPFKKIVFASDLRYRDVGALQVLARLASFSSAEIIVLHVDDKTDTYDKKLEDWFRKQIAEHVMYDKLTYRRETGADVIKAISGVLDTEQPGLLALSLRRRSLVSKILDQNIGKHFMSYTRVPLMFFRNIEPIEETEADKL